MTLLVLNLDLPPDTTASGVAEALGDMVPEMGAYALSLAVIAIFGLVDPRVHRSYLVHGIWRGVTIGGVFLLSLPSLLISATVAQLSSALIAGVQALLARRFGSIHRLPRRAG